jgi:hypothetical protein
VAAKPKTKFSYRQALNYRSAQRPLTSNEKLAVTAFLLFFFVIVGAWLLDDDYVPFKHDLTTYTKVPMDSLGWMQYWGVFSPDMRDRNYHSTALIEFADGSNKIFEFPNTKIDQKDYFSHFGGEKKRKLFNDTMPWPAGTQFLPSIARFIARANDDQANPPRMVTILWHLIPTIGPDPKHWLYRDQLPHHTGQYITFIYKVEPQDLPSGHTDSPNQ